jgi:hypothetical protein
MDEKTNMPAGPPTRLAAVVALIALLVSSLAMIAFRRWGFTYLIDHLGPFMGILTTIVSGAVVFGSLLSIPITLFMGLAAMVVALKRGAMHFLHGLIALASSAVDLFLWVKYGGLPVHL